jgi:hypothetical protein
MKENIYAGTREWRQWMEEVRRTGKLHVSDFAPSEVVLDEQNSVKGIMVLNRGVGAIEEVGSQATPGQVLYWYGDLTEPGLPKGNRAWNVYDVQRNVYPVTSHEGELVRQDELDDDREAALRKLEHLGRAVADHS